MLATEQLLQAVAQLFIPQFAPGAKLVRIAGTDGPTAVCQKAGFAVSGPEVLPDAVLHDSERKRLFLLELSTNHGGARAS